MKMKSRRMKMSEMILTHLGLMERYKMLMPFSTRLKLELVALQLLLTSKIH